MKYTKPALSYEDQFALLATRGLGCPDRERGLAWLKRIGYYQLSAYFVPFKVAGTEDFRPTTTLVQVIDLYKFDCKLRLLVLQALDRIEVAVRAVITYHLAHELGVFGYADPNNFAPTYSHTELMRVIDSEEARSSELFIYHFRSKYISERVLPIWMATELISFGVLSRMYEHLTKRLRKKISREFGQPQTTFVSWLHALTAIRNICAHHNRLWNRKLSVKPELPQAWKDAGLANERFYIIALVIQTLLMQTSPKSLWKERLKSHFSAYPSIDLRAMGFPANWQSQPPWV